MPADPPKLGPRTWDLLVELAEPATSAQLAQRIRLSESGVLMHLRKLRDAGYVESTGVGDQRLWARTEAVTEDLLAHAQSKRRTGGLREVAPEQSRPQAAGQPRSAPCDWCGQTQVPVGAHGELARHVVPGTSGACAGTGRSFRESPAADVRPAPAPAATPAAAPAQGTGGSGPAWLGALVVLALVALLVSQCGGGEDDESLFGPDDSTSDYCLSLRLVILDDSEDEDDRIDAIVDYKRRCKD